MQAEIPHQERVSDDVGGNRCPSLANPLQAELFACSTTFSLKAALKLLFLYYPSVTHTWGRIFVVQYWYNINKLCMLNKQSTVV